MQWDHGVQAGFSTGTPWLKVNPDFLHRNVLAQQADPHSLFHFTKNLLVLRKAQPALHRGDYTPLEAPAGSLAYLRSTPEQSILVAINFKGRPAKFATPDGKWQLLFSSHPESTDPATALAPYEVRLLVMEK
jgi:glycosidase